MVMHRFGIGCLLLAVGCVPSSQLLAQEDTHALTTKLMVLSVPLPSGPSLLASDELPAAITSLLEQGWQLTQTAVVGKNGDGSRVNVLVTLSPPHRSLTGRLPPGFPGGLGDIPGWHDAPLHTAGDAVPGAGIPKAALDKGTLSVHWSDGGTTTIEVGDAIGARSQAHVVTKDSHGATAADYQATAFTDVHGDTEIDSRGAPQTKSSPGYSPDSFLIHPEGQVDIQDDRGTRDSGVLEGSKAQTQPAPASPAAPEAAPAPHGQRQL